MAGGRAIKSRIKSTKSIQQITKAMEAVSAVKMRKSESSAIKGRSFALYALNILQKIQNSLTEDIKNSSPLFMTSLGEKKCLVVIASDKGLAGSFNSNVFKKATQIIEKNTSFIEVITVGKKSREFFERKNIKIIKSFEGMGDYALLDEVTPVSDFIIQTFLSKEFRQIDVIYTNFVSALKQEVLVRPLLPLNEQVLKEVIENILPETGRFSELKTESKKEDSLEYKFEPNPLEIAKTLVPSLVKLEIFHSILEANASEHAARMVAMKNASENAKDMIGKLTIKYNKERQANITKELIEITSGKEALSAQTQD